jgi:hypothetical protein
MKCKLIRDDMEVSTGMPDWFVAENAVSKTVMRNSRMTSVMFWKRGTVMTHPQAHYLVRQGCAVPGDDECAERCNMTPEMLAAAQQAYERVVHGIAPEDFAAFDAGIMSGYDDDGNPKPGPNARLNPGMFEQDDEDEDE